MADKQAKNTKEKGESAPSKEKEGGKKAPSRKDDPVIELLKEMKTKMEQSEQTMQSVVKRVEELENYDPQGDDYGQYGQHHYSYGDFYGQGDSYDLDYGPEPCCSKRPNEETRISLGCDENNNEAVVDSRFSSLAKRFKGQEVTDKDIDTVLSTHISDLFRKGMEEEQYNQLLKDEKLSRPANCEGLSIVKCNQLVWDLISPNARSTDKKLQNIETSVVKSATILAKMVDKTAKIENQIKEKQCEDISFIVDFANDAIALLGHANRQVNLLRKDLLRPELKNEYSHLCNHTVPYTSQLFGDDVSKAAKEIEDAAKIGNKMQHGPYRGGFRGGRSGFRGRPRMRPYPRGFGRGRGYYGYGGAVGQSGSESKNALRRGGLKYPSKN